MAPGREVPVMLSAWLTPILVPPVNLAMLALVAVWWGKRGLAMVALAALLLLGTPLVANRLIDSLETGLSASPAVGGMQAILILGGDVARDSLDQAIPGPLTLERLRAGVALSQATKLPIAVTGGPAWAGGPSIGSIMATSLDHDFGHPAQWVETRSIDTWENARDSAALLLPAGIHNVLIVTQAWHMPRSLLAFQGSGLNAQAAPVMLDKTAWSSAIPPGERLAAELLRPARVDRHRLVSGARLGGLTRRCWRCGRWTQPSWTPCPCSTARRSSRGRAGGGR